MTSKKYLLTKPLRLGHKITWPTIPGRAIRSHSHHLSAHPGFWHKQALTLFLISQGFSLETEIKSLVAQKLGIQANAGSLYRAIIRLDESGILHRTTLRIQLGAALGEVTFALVRLTSRGRGLCRYLATRMDDRWRPHETEWERMRRIHEQGKREPDHTLGTLIFAYQARKRGWKAGVMPNFQEGRFVPDAVVEKGGEKIYVEVELHYGKEAKWRNMHNAMGYMAFCGRSPLHEETLREECKKVGEPIYATNLTSLITGEENLWS